jgi:hypothetical protein
MSGADRYSWGLKVPKKLNCMAWNFVLSVTPVGVWFSDIDLLGSDPEGHLSYGDFRTRLDRPVRQYARRCRDYISAF